MRKLLNTLYITTPDAYLSKDGQNIVVSVKQNEVFFDDGYCVLRDARGRGDGLQIRR